MKLIDIVNELKREGHVIEYRVRTDGGIIITSIDGKKYKNLTEGNREARRLANEPLAPSKLEQRRKNVTKYIKGFKKPRKRLDDDLKRELDKAQRYWRKNNTGGGARPTARKVRWRLKSEGKQATLEYLKRLQRYSMGYAYPENALQQRLRIARLAIQFPEHQQEIFKVLDFIDLIIDVYREEWIAPIYDIIYDIEEYRILCLDGLAKIMLILHS